MQSPVPQGNKETRSRKAAIFPPAEPLDFDTEEKERIARMVVKAYEDDLLIRDEWEGNHLVYDQMFRGKVEEFAIRSGPWEGSSNLHVQLPYWLVDSINVRMVGEIFSQNPLVSGTFEESDDRPVVYKAAKLVEWNVQPNRMNLRALWARLGKIRNIHGTAVGLVHYANDSQTYRAYVQDPREMPVNIVFGPDGMPQLDEKGQLIERPDEPPVAIQRKPIYQGPVVTPLEWDDVVVPMNCMNLQPRRRSNPLGAPRVSIRLRETLSDMVSRYESGDYANMFTGELETEEAWIAARPDQTHSDTDGARDSNARERQQDRMEGRNRSAAQTSFESEDAYADPDYEVLMHFCSYQIPGPSGEWKIREEVVFFVCRNPKKFLGGFRLSDVVWTGRRPLFELHYQTISNRFYSMGVPEIGEHISAELDTLHNMRIDVGQATNMPFFFYKATSNFNPDEVELRPMKGVPVDDPNNFSFPAFQNVTTFYEREEINLLTLAERVFGVTDLFLGMSPTRGAAARTATGFVGTQQESNARMGEIMAQDAASFSFLCHLIYDLEMQYGPDERQIRLFGHKSELQEHITRDDLWFKGTYDFRLGASTGVQSQSFRMQQAQGVLQTSKQSPLTGQDMGRIWEAEARFYRSIGLTEPEIEELIGPKTAVAQATPKTQDEENQQMSQYAFGVGIPAPINPADNDMEHIQKIQEYIASPEYAILGKPNQSGILAHANAHQQQMMAKQQQAQMQMMQQQGGKPMGMGGGADPMNRAAAQMGGGATQQPTNMNIQQSMMGNRGGGMVSQPQQNGGFPSPPRGQ